MTEKIKACMGGWCIERNNCEHYAARDRLEPAERLCEPGRDGVMKTSLIRPSVRKQMEAEQECES